MKKHIYLLKGVFITLLCGIHFVNAQTYRTLVQENFGTGTANPSTTPTNNLLPGVTNYTAQTTYTTLPDGSYALALNPNGYDNFGNVTSAWQHGYDHTTGTGNGYMMLINADPTHQGETNGAYYLYKSSAFDIPGAQYAISFSAANLLAYNLSSRFSGTTFKDGYLGMSIYDNSGTHYSMTNMLTPICVNGTANATTGTTTVGATGTSFSWILGRATNDQNHVPWNNFQISFTVPTTYAGTGLNFNFYNSDNNSSTYGNDLTVDDITIQLRVITGGVSGTFFDDANGNGVQDAGESAVNGSSLSLYAYLVKANGTIISKTPVNANGTYTFDESVVAGSGVPYSTFNLGMKIMYSTQNLNPGSVLSTTTYPANYTATSANTNGAANATAGSSGNFITLTQTTAPMANLNFGIEQMPYTNAVNKGPLAAWQFPLTDRPGYRGILSSDPSAAPFSGNDPEDGVKGSGSTFQIINIASGTMLVYNGATLSNGSTITNYTPSLLRIYVSTSSSGASFTYSAVDNANKTSATAAAYNLFSSNPLPVFLESFVVNKSGGSAALNWVTSQEINSSAFEIERSPDGQSFSSIGAVKAKGSSTEPSSYVYTDAQPMEGKNYYRLKMVDINTQFTYSDIRSVLFSSGELSQNNIKVFPNPVVDNLNIIVPGALSGNLYLEIIAVDGSIVLKQLISNSNGASISVRASSLTSGVYFIKLFNANSGILYKGKFIKK